MSANSATPSTIDLNDPRLTSVEYLYDEWCPVVEDDKGKCHIAPRYAHLELTAQQAILWLWENFHEETARRYATCGLRGSVHKRCKKGKRARAHRHTCHCWICRFCGQAKSLLLCWLRTRRPEVCSERQYGLELCGPPDDKALAAYAAKFSQWLRSRSIPNAYRMEITIHKKRSAFRMVVKTDKLPFAELRDYWSKITAQGYSLTLHNESTPISLLHWMFASSEEVLQACGHTRAKLYSRYYKHRMLRTAGAFYAPSKAAKVEEFSEVAAEPTIFNSCNCGECDGIMETIPWEERTVQTVEKIEESYEHVDWSSCHDPFKVERKEGLTHKSEVRYSDSPTMTAVAPSPPPW
jgi:hypothetical protein